MQVKNIFVTLFVTLLTIQVTLAQQEPIANKPNVTYSDVIEHIEKLISTGTDDALNLLRLEATALAKSEHEDFRALSALMHERLFEEADKAQEIRDEIEQKFPKGKFARAREFGKLFTEEGLSAIEMEQRYQTLLQEFPKENFKEGELEIYDHASLELSGKYAGEGNLDKAIEQINTLEEGKYYVVGVANIYENLPEKSAEPSLLSLVEKAYKKSVIATASGDEDVRTSYDAMLMDPISAIYAAILLQSGKQDEALRISSLQLEKSVSEEINVPMHLITAVTVLEQQNKKNDALELLEKYIIATDKAPEMVEAYKRLYVDVHGAGSDPDVALARIDEKAKEVAYALYEQEMIKEEAPGFTLLNREGKAVSLSDYKGKVVVLDFWATWCGPCVVSFPGMQAAVNKYENDPEVEFLFIDTWQKEDNYKEVVEKFLTENNYNFHVLFDEMKDRSKAVVNAYNIRGIPTKIVIDKEGFIRFRSSGGEQDIDKAVSEMEAKIELARKG